jgi:hypothetical protein
MFETLLKKLKKLVQLCNSYGIPLPLARDPKTGIGSVSLTLVFISSIMVILGLVGKWSGKLGVVDINNALEFFYASSFLYFGRNWRTGASAKEETEENSGAQPKNDLPPKK